MPPVLAVLWRRDRSGRFTAGVVGLYLLLGSTLVLHHEPWRDEADAWLIARDFTAGNLFYLTGASGQPAPWFLILAPFAKAGLPYYPTLGWIHLAIAAAAVAVFVHTAPFSRLLRGCFAFSYFMAFELAAVARNYSLAALALFLVAALHHRRFDHPLLYGGALALLFNTHAQVFLLAAAILVADAWEVARGPQRDARGWTAVGLAAAGGAAAVLQLLPPADGQLVGLMNHFEPNKIYDGLRHAFVPTLHFRSTAWLTIAILAATLVALARRPRLLFILASAYVWIFYIVVCKHYGGVRHYAFLQLSLLYVLWIASVENEATDPPAAGGRAFAVAQALVTLALAVSCLVTLRYTRWEIEHSFSNAREMALFLRTSGLQTQPLAAHPATHGAAVLAFLDVPRLFYPGISAYGSHMLWNRASKAGEVISTEEALSRLERHFPDPSQVLLLLTEPLGQPGRHGASLVYATRGKAFARPDENFFLYRFSPRPRARSAVPL